MLENIFVLFVIISFLTTIFAYVKESIIYSVMSAILWLIVMANSIFIEVPFSTGADSYMDYGFSILCLIFIFVNIIQTVMFIGKHRQEDELNP